MIYHVLINTITNSNISWESRSKYAEITEEQTQPTTAILNIQLLPHNHRAGIIYQKTKIDLEGKDQILCLLPAHASLIPLLLL